MKILLIDGNNLGIRSAFANCDLSVDMIDFKNEDFNPDDAFGSDKKFPTGALHGFFRSMAMLKEQYPEHYIAVVWDGGYKRRLEVSDEAVKAGIIPETYKANRRRGEIPQPIKDYVKQKPILQQALSMTNFPQIVKDGEEADDVIASYASLSCFEEVLISTNDKDYYQILNPRVMIVTSDGSILTDEWFKRKFGIDPERWVDVGAFEGDDGDNIFGIPGWGSVTAIKEVARHGSSDKVLAALHEKYDSLRQKYPDLTGQEFATLKDIKTPSGKPKWPEITDGMPFTGVALACDKGLIKAPKTDLTALMFERRMELARFLKKMKADIPVPELPDMNRQLEEGFREICTKYSLFKVAEVATSLCSPQKISKKGVASQEPLL